MIPCPCCCKGEPEFLENVELRAVCEELESKLLTLGGKAVVFPEDEIGLADVVQHGKIFTEKVRLVKGPLNRQWYNAAMLWGRDIPNTQLVVGYSLADDGLWYQHVWAVKSQRLLETTVKRRKYFGRKLSQQAALDFWMAHVAAERYAELNEDSFDDAMRRYPGPMRLIVEDMKKDYHDSRAEIGQHMEAGVPYQGRNFRVLPSQPPSPANRESPFGVN